jgi:uncharacterized protein YbjQ (UPF0145 family)
MNGYIAFFNGRRAEIYTDTLHQAKEEAIKRLKVPKSKQGLLAVELAETNVQLDANGKPTHGTQHIIKPDF